MYTRKAFSRVVAAFLVSSLLAAPFSSAVFAAETSGKLEGSEIKWSYNDKTNTLTLTGNGDSTLTSLNGAPAAKKINIEGIRQIDCSLWFDYIYLGEDVEIFRENEYESGMIDPPFANDAYEVDDDNPYYADYNGALYNKDLTYLYHVPSHQREVQLADKLETLGKDSFQYTSAKYIVIPWGTTVAEKYGLGYVRRDENYEETYGVEDYPYIIIPDTLRTIGWIDKYPLVQYIYSDHYTDIPLDRLYPEISEYEREANRYRWRNQYLDELGFTSFNSIYGITASTFKTFGGKTYYFDENCKMVVGTRVIDGKTYHFDENGVLQGEVESSTPAANKLTYKNGKTYIYDGNGKMLRSGWYQADGNWYYLNDSGAGVVNCWRLKDGKYRYLKSDGSMAHDEWVEDYGNRYYVIADGTRYESRWAKMNGKWYWFGGSGKMMKDGWLKLADGNWYYFYENGQMATGWIEDGGKKYYLHGSGAMKTGWLQRGSDWYYMDGSGAMVKNKWIRTGKYWYYLGSNGVMLTNTTTPDGYKVNGEGKWV